MCSRDVCRVVLFVHKCMKIADAVRQQLRCSVVLHCTSKMRRGVYWDVQKLMTLCAQVLSAVQGGGTHPAKPLPKALIWVSLVALAE
jgi:hypothetical protein